MSKGLVIAWDTFDNTNDPPSIEVFADGVSVGNFPQTFPFNNTDQVVAIHWDFNGLDITVGGVAICTNLQTSGFVPAAGNKFAFSARTGGATQDAYIDDLAITTATSIPIETGGPIISEFCADNTRFEDEDVEAPDWIEIYNGQNTPVNLGGWHLTDNLGVPGRWTFPSVNVGAYQYLVVYASAKNRQLTNQPLHTDFTLQKAGGTIALTRPDNTVASEFTYGPQVEDVSFGEQGNLRTTGYMFPATPGAKNDGQIAAGPPSEEVVWSRESGLITGATSLSIAAAQAAGSVIRYTTNNTDPTASSAIYDPASPPAAFSFTNSVNFRARVFTADHLPGPVSSRTFLRLDPTLTNYAGSGRTFSSHLPIIVLDSFGVPVDSYTDPGQARPFRYTYSVVFDRDPATGRASLSGTPNYIGRGATHVRGESSSGFPQKQYSWELWNDENRDKEASLLGMPAESDWVLHAPYTDKTLMRNFLVYTRMFQWRGEGAGMRTKFCEVFFNQENGQAVSTADYRGIYVLVEKIKRARDRVEVQKLNSLTTDPAKITGGYIFKKDKPSVGNTSWTTTGGIPLETQDPEVLNSPQLNYLRGYLNGFESALNGANFADPTNGYQAFIDRDSFIDNQWWVEVAKQIDGYRISTYYYKDRGGKIVNLPLWDYNLSLFNADYSAGDTPTGWYYTTVSGSNYPWYPRLHQDVNYRVRHWDRYWELRRTIFANTGAGPENFLNLIDSTAAELLNGGSGNVGNNTPAMPAEQENAVMRHFRRWRILGTYVWPNPAGFAQRTTYQSEITAMKNFINARLAWIDDQNFVGTVIYRPPVLSSNGGSVPSGTSLTIAPYAGTPPTGRTYATGTLYYTLDGSDPRLHGGAVAPGAIPYTGPITLTGPATVNARLLSATGNNWSPVANAEFTVDTVPASAANLVVSEVMYHPRAATPEESAAGYGENDFEFVELLNVGTQSIDLTGCELRDAVNFDFDVADPGTLTLAPGARLLVVANRAAFAARYGDNPATKIAGVFSGSLSNSGELFTLRAASGEIIAQFTWADVDPWPAGADVGGASLLLSNPTPNPDYTAPASWRASLQADGSPGLGEAPIVVTLDASEITATSAKLNAEINPNGSDASAEFVIADVHYPAGNLAGSITPTIVSQALTGLAPHTAYTVTAVSTNAVASRTGAPVIFNTLNRLPEVQPKSFHFPTRDPVTLDILAAAVSDPDGDALTITEVGAGQHGVVTTDGQKVFYAPSDAYAGNDTFTYTVNDGFGGTASGTITLENAAPIAQLDSVESNGEPVTFDPRSNDTDADSDSLSVASVTQGSAGTVTITETGSIQYTPGAAYVRRDSFSYTITDGSATATATVQVRTTEPRPVIGAAKGAAVPGEPAGTVYGDLGVPTMGVFSGSVLVGSNAHRAIFAPDGSVRLQEGDPAPGIDGAVIAKLGEPSGQAVIVKLSGANVRPQNDTALYVGLINGPVQLGAREGSSVDGSSLKAFLSIDGNGATTFFRCKLSGAGVKSANDVALGAVLADGTMRVLTREGKIVGGKTIAVLGTLVGARGTLAESRWRAGEDAIGVRLTLDGKTQAVYTIPTSATSSDQWTLWAQTGDDCVARGKAATFGLPGFGPDGAAYTTQLLRERFGSVGKSNDTLMLREKVENLNLVADESGTIPGSDGAPLPGVRFKKFLDPVAGADGRIAFIATVTGQGVRATNNTGIWFTAGDGSVRLLARAGDLAPGGGRWASFESLALPDGVESAPLFTGLLALDAGAGVSRTNRRGLWAADSGGTLHLLLRAGRPLTVNGAARTIESFVALAPAPDSLGAAQGFDQEGNVTALVTFTDGSEAIVAISLP
jgi:hypothetical protein